MALPSVRARTALAATVVVGVALSIGAVVLVHLVSDSLRARVDSSARLRADSVVALAQRGSLPKVLVGRDYDTEFVQVYSNDGHVLAASSNVAGDPPLVASRAVPPGGVIRTVHHVPDTDQATFRVALFPVSTPTGTVVVAYAVSLAPAQHTVRTMVGALALGLPLMLMLVATTAWILVGRALAPVEAIRAQVAEISALALDRRVPEAGGRDEIARLARTMNDMLARLESSMRKQRQFVADASHELRSPLATALAQLDIDLAHPETADRTASVQVVRDELQRLCQIVEDLLVLARANESGLNRQRRPVDLHLIVLAACDSARSATFVAVNDDLVEAVDVIGDPDQLRRMVANLLSNATRHARTHVDVTLSREGADAVLLVADDGPGIPVDEHGRIFERFTRLDNARARDVGGSGLGLAIVKDIVDAHDGTIAVSNTRPGACFVVVLPAVADHCHPADRTATSSQDMTITQKTQNSAATPVDSSGGSTVQGRG